MEALIFIACVIAILALIFGLMSLSAGILMWAWNLVMPLLWVAAPILTFWPAFAIVVLLGFVGGVFNRTTVVKGKD